VINRNEYHCVVDSDTGRESYTNDSGGTCLAFRFVNMRKRQCVGTTFRLILIRKGLVLFVKRNTSSAFFCWCFGVQFYVDMDVLCFSLSSICVNVYGGRNFCF